MNAEQETHRKPIVVRFSRGHAGQVIGRVQDSYSGYKRRVACGKENLFEPFANKIDWEFAKWAKTRGPGSTAVSELLKINGVSTYLSLTAHSHP